MTKQKGKNENRSNGKARRGFPLGMTKQKGKNENRSNGKGEKRIPFGNDKPEMQVPRDV